MKRHPKFQAERLRLHNHLNTQKELIQDDIHGLKEAVKPLSIARDLIGQAADSFKDNSMAIQGTRLVLGMIPGRRRPLVGIAAQIVVPLLLKNIPRLIGIAKSASPQMKKSYVLGTLRKAVRSLRSKLDDS